MRMYGTTPLSAGIAQTYSLVSDPRTWHSRINVVETSVALPSVSGTLYLLLSDPDYPANPLYSIACANTGVFESATGYRDLLLPQPKQLLCNNIADYSRCLIEHREFFAVLTVRLPVLAFWEPTWQEFSGKGPFCCRVGSEIGLIRVLAVNTAKAGCIRQSPQSWRLKVKRRHTPAEGLLGGGGVVYPATGAGGKRHNWPCGAQSAV